MTTQIIWTKELYGTGVDLIDTQHQELFKRINAVLQAVETNARQPDVTGLLKHLEEYTISHFSCEEKLMDERKCKVACANKAAHTHFLKEFTRLSQDFKTSGVTLQFAADLKKMITSWLRSHIMTIDTNLKDTATS